VYVPRAEAEQLFCTFADPPLLRAKANARADLAVKIGSRGQGQPLHSPTRSPRAKRGYASRPTRGAVYRGRPERLAAEKHKEMRWLRCQPNAYIESFNGRFRDERVNESWFTTLGDTAHDRRVAAGLQYAATPQIARRSHAG